MTQLTNRETSNSMACPRRWVWAGVAATQAVWIGLLASASSPMRAVAAVLAVVCGVAILISPHLGVYVTATLLIGQWPWNLMRILGIVTVVSAAIWLTVRRKPWFARSTILWLTILFQVFVLISAVRPLTRVDLLSQVLTYLGNGALVWLFVTLIDRRVMILNVMRLMVLSGIVTAIVGLVQWRTHFVWVASTTRYFLTVD
ncbi:MAG TPA: hypothetical protein VIY86_08990, partial [Pirellulaceae bacterium]